MYLAFILVSYRRKSQMEALDNSSQKRQNGHSHHLNWEKITLGRKQLIVIRQYYSQIFSEQNAISINLKLIRLFFVQTHPGDPENKTLYKQDVSFSLSYCHDKWTGKSKHHFLLKVTVLLKILTHSYVWHKKMSAHSVQPQTHE